MAAEQTELRRRGIGSKEESNEPDRKETSRSRFLLQLAEEKDESSKALVKYVIQQLKSQGLSCRVVEAKEEKYLVVTAEFDILAKQAEKQKWERPLKNSDEVLEFTVKQLSKFQHSDDGHLFTSAEEVQLLYHAIQDTPYDVTIFSKDKRKVAEGKGLLTVLQRSKPAVVEEAYPLHNWKEITELSSMFKLSFIPMRGLNLDKIRNYFGEDTAFYFGWMNFYMTFITIPAVVGLAMYFLRPSGISVDTDAYLPFFSVIMAIWGVLFLVYWQRRSTVHSFQWNTYSYSASDELRPEYHGNACTDPVTQRSTVYYPGWKRKLWYVFSFLAMVPLLTLGVGVMALSLNLNGYVKSTESPIYVASLAKYAQPGGLFAADSPYFLWLVPTLAHSVIVSIINQLYSRVATKCTDLENHRTMQRWHSSLVVKRVFFECFDCFMPLFYIAFYQLDVVTLRAEIASLFMSDEIRRVTVETVIPFVSELLRSKKREKEGGRGLERDTIRAEYDQFDDYLEMVIQFGYITLFASAFPLGGAVTLLFLFVEVRSDFFKLLHAYRRPSPMRSSGIGVWYDVMRVMVFGAILTNCAILGFSSEQLLQWMPWLFIRDEGDQAMALGSGRYVVGIVFGFEHVLLVLALWLQWMIKPVPKWVRLAVARREFLARERVARERAGEDKQE